MTPEEAQELRRDKTVCAYEPQDDHVCAMPVYHSGPHAYYDAPAGSGDVALPTAASTHVDVVSNDWHAGVQRIRGRIEWHPSVETDGHIGDAMLDAVARKYCEGSYVFASEPHEAGGCPFRESATRAMSIRWAP